MKKIITSLVFITIFVLLSSCGLPHETSRYEAYKKSYTRSEIATIDQDTFKKLNNITFPSLALEKNGVNGEYILAVRSFANNVYQHLEKTDNFSFSPMGLYAVLSIMSMGCSNPEYNELIDQLLCTNKATRNHNYASFYKNNYFARDTGTTQIYNGLFTTNQYELNNSFLSKLADYYCEAYELDFNKDADVAKMLDWVNSRVQEQGFLKKADLVINEETVMIIFNTLYFNNKWQHTFMTSSTYPDDFYLQNGNTVTAQYMRHSYRGDVYDYDKYISAYDYYYNGYKVQYLTPKDVNDSIYDLIKNVNFLIEDETKKLTPSDLNYQDNIIINLSVPRFESECMLDFKSVLTTLGLGVIFDRFSYAFNDAYTGLDSDTSIYLQYIKQKNKVSFNEDGTIVKSVTYGSLGGATSAAPRVYDTIDIKLDSSFIYVIYDADNIPLYIGHVDNPSK